MADVDLGFDKRVSPYYSGNVENIKRLLSQAGIGNARLDAITEEFTEVIQAEVDDNIDDQLRHLYGVPLSQVTRGGRTAFPGVIEYIASRLVAYRIITIEFSGQEPNNVSASSTAYYNDAMDRLNSLINGKLAPTNRLQGQRLKGRVRYVSPTQAPSIPPVMGGGGQTPTTT